MGFTAALGFACIISLSACGESGRVEVSDRRQTPAVHIQCPVGSLEACGRGLLEHEAAAEPANIPLELSRVIPIVIPSGKTSSRRTVVSADEIPETEPPKLEVPELEVPEIPELQPESLAALTLEPSAFEPQGEPNRSALPPLPPLRNHGVEALRTLDHHDQADLALASLQIAEQTSAVRRIAADVEPASSEETELDKQVGRRDPVAIASRKELSDLDETAKTITLSQGLLAEDADVSAPLRRLPSNNDESTAPAILRDRSVISDRPLNPAPVAGLRPTNDASRLKLEMKEVRILHSQESVHRIVPSGEHVCEVVMFNPREIALIGRQLGTMQLDFWYDDQGTKRTRYSVTVHEDPASQDASVEGFQRIETVIHQLFPGSRIECQREPARLIVRGVAQNERQAIEIISTIRRSQLIPVIDLIEIRAHDRRIQMP